MHAEAIQVLAEEGAADVARGQDGVVALEATPFGEVVGDIERRGRGRGVLVVDEGYTGGRFVLLGAV